MCIRDRTECCDKLLVKYGDTDIVFVKSLNEDGSAQTIMARTKEGTVPFDMYRQLENPITFKDQDYDEDGNKIEVDVPTYLIMAFRPGHPVYVAKDGWTMDLQVHVVQSGPAAECPELTTTDWYQVLAGETPGSPYHFNRFYPVHLHLSLIHI